MKNTFVKAILLSTLSLSSINIVNANQVTNHDLKTYVLKITANDPNKVVPFSGSFMSVSDDNDVLTNIPNQITPSEIPIKAHFLATMIQSSDRNSEIKVEILENNDKGQQSILTGIGHSIVTHNGSRTGTYVFAK